MAVKSFSLTVTTTAQQITTTDTDIMKGTTLWIHNHEHNNNHSIYIGGSDVTTANGLHIPAQETLGPIFIQTHESIYIISDTAEGAAVSIFQVGAA